MMIQKIKECISNNKSKFESVVLFQWFGISNPVSNRFTTFSGATDAFIEILNTAALWSSVAAIFVVIYGAYNLILASGDDEKISTGQAAITNGIIGLVIVFIARILIQFVYQQFIA